MATAGPVVFVAVSDWIVTSVPTLLKTKPAPPVDFRVRLLTPIVARSHIRQIEALALCVVIEVAGTEVGDVGSSTIEDNSACQSPELIWISLKVTLPDEFVRWIESPVVEVKIRSCRLKSSRHLIRCNPTARTAPANREPRDFGVGR